VKSLRALILPYATDVSLGSTKMEGLAGKLRGLSRRNEKYFRVCIGLLVVILLSSLCFVILFRNQPAIIAGVFTALGASAYGGVRQMVQLWREKVATDVLVELVTVLPQTEVLMLLKDVFLKRLD
jgi:hypothetical protein